MTGEQALAQAIELHPLDLVERVSFLRRMLDVSEPGERSAWSWAYWLTRNGVTS